ncbi:MAG: signal peptidase I, partial [Candidatus Tagabacteria bacterium]
IIGLMNGEIKDKIEKPKLKKEIWEFVKFTFIALIIVIPIRMWIAQPFIVQGSSMVPSFESGDYLIIDEISYQFRQPEKGEVIVFRYPQNPSQFFIKRVAGLPGETINNTNLTSDEYYVLGDNTFASSDSRYWGPVKKDLIIGRAILRLWPLSNLGVL